MQALFAAENPDVQSARPRVGMSRTRAGRRLWHPSWWSPWATLGRRKCRNGALLDVGSPKKQLQPPVRGFASPTAHRAQRARKVRHFCYLKRSSLRHDTCGPALAVGGEVWRRRCHARAARCRAGARETSKFARSCTPRSATERVGLGGYVAAMGPVRVRDKHNAPRGAAGTHAHAPAPRLKNRRPSGPKTHFYLKIFRRRPLLNHKTSRRSCS